MGRRALATPDGTKSPGMVDGSSNCKSRAIALRYSSQEAFDAMEGRLGFPDPDSTRVKTSFEALLDRLTVGWPMSPTNPTRR